MERSFLGFVLGIVAVAAVVFLYLRFGRAAGGGGGRAVSVGEADREVPLHARIEREMKTAPFGTSEDVFEGWREGVSGAVRELPWDAGARCGVCEAYVSECAAALEEACARATWWA